MTLDLSPYFAQPTRRVTLYRLVGSTLTTTDITASSSTLGQTKVTFQPGETVAGSFIQSESLIEARLGQGRPDHERSRLTQIARYGNGDTLDFRQEVVSGCLIGAQHYGHR